jgi:hypothetical protein
MSRSRTSPAVAATARHPGVRGIVRMARRAMCAPELTSRNAVAAANILSLRHCLKVRGVNAISLSAEMVNDESVINGAINEPVCDAMGAAIVVGSQLEMPVTRGVDSGGPDKAIPHPDDFGPEALFQGLEKLRAVVRERISVTTPSRVMRPAPASAVDDRAVTHRDIARGGYLAHAG